MNALFLNNKHKLANAKFIEFNGWSMPVHYGSIIDEHNCVRNNIGLFDVSHMGNIFISGKNAEDLLAFILPADIENMYPGKAVYTQLLNDAAGIIDDLIVYKIADDEFMLIVNAGNIKKDYDWILQHNSDFGANCINASQDYCILALQGPNTEKVVTQLFSLNFNDLRRFHFKTFDFKNEKLYIARTGYTGEPGVEIIVKNTVAEFIFDKILIALKNFDGMLIGLGARDTLRLEAGYPLHGQDIDESTTPIEAGLGWSIKSKKNYIGKTIIDKQLNEGVSKKLCGFVIADKSIARHNTLIFDGAEAVGEVTSGSFSPSLNKPIGLAYIKTEYLISQNLKADIRGKYMSIKIVDIPFIKKNI